MEDSKFALTSKTVIGALMVMLAPLINKYFGTNIDLALQVEISDALVAFMVNGGAMLAIYGRIKATKKLSLLP